MKALLKKYGITNAKSIDQADEYSITWLKPGGALHIILDIIK